MKDIQNVNCVIASTVDKSRPNLNFSNYAKLLSGIVYKQSSLYTQYKSILEFDLSDFDIANIESLFINLFVEKMDIVDDETITLILSLITEPNNIENTNWSNFPKTNSENSLHITLSNKDINKYVKIDISQFLNFCTNANKLYYITIESEEKNNTSIIQLSSYNSTTTPYIHISNKSVPSTSSLLEMINDCNSIQKILSDEINSLKEALSIQQEMFRNPSVNIELDSMKKAITEINNTKDSLLSTIDTIQQDINDIKDKLNQIYLNPIEL